MALIAINNDLFWSRARGCLRVLTDSRNEQGSALFGVDAVMVWIGKQDQQPITSTTFGVGHENKMEMDPEPSSSATYMQSKVLSLHLLDGYEFPDTLFVVHQGGLIVATSEKKIKVLQTAIKKPGVKSETPFEIVYLERGKTIQDFEQKVFNKLKPIIQKSFAGKKIALTSDTSEFGKALTTYITNNDFKMCSGLAGLEDLLFEKDEAAQSKIQKACEIVAKATDKWRRGLAELDQDDDKLTHSELQKQLDATLRKGDQQDVELLFPSSIQSGDATRFTLELGVPATTQQQSAKLSFSEIMINVGVRNLGYCALLSRTLFVDPSKEQENAYSIALQAHDATVEALKPGRRLADAYNAAAQLIENSDMPTLTLGADIGFGLGLSPCEPEAHLLAATNQRIVKPGSVFYVCITFKGICPLRIGNMVTVASNSGGENTVLTETAKYAWNKIHFKMAQSEDEDDDDDDGGGGTGADGAEATTSSTRATTRRQTRSMEQNADKKAKNDLAKQEEQEIQQHQVERMQEKAKRAGGAGGAAMSGGDENQDPAAQGSLARAYKTTKDYPSSLQPDSIVIESSAECVFLPISGMHVPFHISTIKNVTKIDDPDSSTLRFNFFFPAGTLPKEAGPEMKRALVDFPHLCYVKELSFRTKDVRAVTNHLREVKELQKRVKDRQKKQIEEKDLVEQQDLILLKDRTKEAGGTLSDVLLLPTLGRGNRCQGRLRCHVNGFRFQVDKTGETLDILFTNVFNFFFQPSSAKDGTATDLKVLIHFFLRNPIMVGKKKTRHVQFYTEVAEGSSALSGRGAESKLDPDEVDEEARERKLRKKLDSIFATFCSQCLEIARSHGNSIGEENIVVKVNDAVRTLAFTGTPFKEMVTIYPTSQALISLSEQRDFFVANPEEIEHIHFERVTIGRSRNFDIVIIWKTQMALDGSGDNIHVQKIEMIDQQHLDSIRKWIDTQPGLTFTMGSASLNWPEVLNSVRDELRRGVFWKDHDPELDDDEENGDTKKDVGWNFLSQGDEDDDEEDDSDDEDEEDPSASDDSDDSDDDDDDDDDSSFGSEVDEDESDVEADSDDEVDSEEDRNWEEKVAQEDERAKKREREREERDAGGKRKKKARRDDDDD